MYIGHSFYSGFVTASCTGIAEKVFPHDIVGLKIYDNIVERTGYDGIQVGCAIKDVEVFNNTVISAGLLEIG